MHLNVAEIVDFFFHFTYLWNLLLFLQHLDEVPTPPGLKQGSRSQLVALISITACYWHLSLPTRSFWLNCFSELLPLSRSQVTDYQLTQQTTQDTNRLIVLKGVRWHFCQIGREAAQFEHLLKQFYTRVKHQSDFIHWQLTPGTIGSVLAAAYIASDYIFIRLSLFWISLVVSVV